MKILFSHFGVIGKGGWGRTFPLAREIANIGNSVTLLTTNPKFSLRIKVRFIEGVRVIIFPDFISSKFTSKGFGFLSVLLKLVFVVFNRFDVVHSDAGHRPSSGLPCRMNKRIYNSIYIAEWWDLFGKGGQYDSKSFLFKFFLGNYELKWEQKDKMFADGIVVLSDYMKNIALKIKNLDRIVKIHGGSDIDNIDFVKDNSLLKKKLGVEDNTLVFGYLDAYDSKLSELDIFIEGLLELKEEIRLKLYVFGLDLDMSVKNKLGNILVNYGWIDFSRESDAFSCVDVFVMFKEENKANVAGWPNKIGDYLAAGRPILLNPVGEMIDFAEEFNDSFIVSENVKDAIIVKINEINDKKNELKEIGVINRQIAESSISWRNKGEELLSFYNRIKDATTNTTA